MYNPSDISHKTIEAIFYEQMRRCTKRSCAADSFDIQFSGSWI